MYSFRVSTVAAADIEDIARYISLDNPARAETFIVELYTKVRQIAERPMSFPARDEISPFLRSALHGKYLVLFRLENDMVDILRIVHGSRDLENLF